MTESMIRQEEEAQEIGAKIEQEHEEVYNDVVQSMMVWITEMSTKDMVDMAHYAPQIGNHEDMVDDTLEHLKSELLAVLEGL